jgi:hypothetical protein
MASAQSVLAQASTPLPQVNEAPAFAPQQLDQLLAPIALYPDPLLAQILMASTYPLELVLAARWIQDPNNAALRGDQLNAALQQQDWDPSVKSLVPFPQIVQMMNSKLDWTQALGNAFLAQQADVMDSVQRLRAQAQAAGTLRSTQQETVSAQGQTIAIEPANPQLVYVPYYDPNSVYGTWGYPDYPPVYFPPPPNYGYVAGPTIFFGIGLGIIDALWGWDQWDWGRRDIRIDSNRYNAINNYAIVHDNRPRFTGNTWQHDAFHRRGVPYSSPAVRQQFQPASAGSADARRDFRGYDNRGATPTAVPRSTESGRPGAAQQATGRQGPPPGEARRVGQAGAPTGQTPQANARTATPPAAHGPAAAVGGVAPRPDETERPGPGQQASLPRGSTPQANARTVTPPSPQRVPATTRAVPQPAIQRPVAPAFSSFGRGADVQAQSQRGQTSRQSMTTVAGPRTAAPPPRAAAPEQRSAAPQPRPTAPARGSQQGGGNARQRQ